MVTFCAAIRMSAPERRGRTAARRRPRTLCAPRGGQIRHDPELDFRVSVSGTGEIRMQVLAFSTPARPEWRWRIMDLSGDIVEESHEGYGSIAAAVAAGAAPAGERTRRELGRRNPVPMESAEWRPR